MICPLRPHCEPAGWVAAGCPCELLLPDEVLLAQMGTQEGRQGPRQGLQGASGVEGVPEGGECDGRSGGLASAAGGEVEG
jgi:hypothetical protein